MAVTLFINVGRGEHVAEADLIALIDEGHLAGAALDVFAKEPPSADDPIWNHPRIEATPHIAADPSYELVARQCIENLWRARDGAGAVEPGGSGRPAIDGLVGQAARTLPARYSGAGWGAAAGVAAGFLSAVPLYAKYLALAPFAQYATVKCLLSRP